MGGPIKIGGSMGGWTVKALEKDGSAPRYSAECNGQKGTLTYYPLMGPRTLVHQTLGARLKRWDGLSHPSLVEVKGGREERVVVNIDEMTGRNIAGVVSTIMYDLSLPGLENKNLDLALIE